MGYRTPDYAAMHRGKLGTLLLHPHPSEWLPLKYGRKTEFRTLVNFPEKVLTPTPCVLWRRVASRIETAPFVLEEAFREPLGAISAESLAREGCADMADFRDRWVASRLTYFDATRQVCVWRVRVWAEGDAEAMGARLLERLYGPYLR